MGLRVKPHAAHQNFMSSMLRRMEGHVGSTLASLGVQVRGHGSKQMLARKWWECGGNACDEAQRKREEESASSVGTHMGALERFRKKNCRTAECIYANSATGFNVPGTGKTGHRWDADGKVGMSLFFALVLLSMLVFLCTYGMQ